MCILQIDGFEWTHQLNLQFITVNLEIFGRILLSRIALKDIFAMF